MSKDWKCYAEGARRAQIWKEGPCRLDGRGATRRQGCRLGGGHAAHARPFGDLVVPRAAFQSVFVRGSAANEAAVGAAVGFVPAFLLGFWFVGEYCNWGGPDDCGDAGYGAAVGAGAVLAVPPAAVGALIGSLAGRRWRRRSVNGPSATLRVQQGRVALGAALRF